MCIELKDAVKRRVCDYIIGAMLLAVLGVGWMIKFQQTEHDQSALQLASSFATTTQQYLRGQYGASEQILGR